MVRIIILVRETTEGDSDMANVLVRPARRRDLEAIVELNHSLFQEDSGSRDPYTNADWPRQEGADYFSQHITENDSLVLMAESEEEPIGYLVGYLRRSYSVRPVRLAELESMFVARNARSCGIGQQLVEAFLLWSHEREAQRVSVTAFASNEGAIRFYKRCGFEPHSVALERSV